MISMSANNDPDPIDALPKLGPRRVTFFDRVSNTLKMGERFSKIINKTGQGKKINPKINSKFFGTGDKCLVRPV